MSGRIAYLEAGKQMVCDMATGRRTLAEDLNSFWSQHAHRDIEIEWVNHDDPSREFSTFFDYRGHTKACALQATRRDLGFRCSPVRWDAQTGSHSFLEYHA